MNYKSIGQKLRKHYEEIGMTQTDIAIKHKCTQGQINRIFSGQFTSKSEIAKKLSKEAMIDLKSTVATDSLISVFNEVYRLWDGSPEGARKLKTILSSIRSLK
ncbi:XRE family transcriptional regulator [Mariprofundus sp. EBB-1]|uniref:helix-turn-helix domain-containing protein n=1 Tax=Mariprofundus sp. EBB-1 TaxID=2650971 RepID=UPI000EF24E34|nr:helix-turn-helix transcriptional regulator [Mariprofundus sp. EBB-1]RLL51726.1 XRE family transcriptional regulator [Mariprofundus sp. EBB-1]